jgi:hypothetical protein
MKKKKIIQLFAILLCLNCYSQSEIEKVIAKTDVYKLRIRHYDYEKETRLPFGKIVVIDERFDTSKLAYIQRGKTAFGRAILPTTWDNILNRHFKKVLDSSSSNDLIIVVRTFWIAANNSGSLPRHKVDETGLGVIEEFVTALDVYWHKDSVFKALYRIENNNQFVFKDFVTGDGRSFFFLPFDSVFNRLFNSDINKLIASKKEITAGAFREYYFNRKNIPILNESNINTGVYLTFNDFKQNQPAKIQYRVDRGKATDEVYLIKNGKEKLLVDFWAVFDDKKLFIKHGLNIFEAIKQNNTFEIFGGNQIVTRYFGGGGGPVSSDPSQFQTPFKTGNKILKSMMQLNMDDGILY